jgi:CheY-like chemotaxis protein/anti-sigma regulatory factor (Ser/Thr protein kinase)
VEVEIALEKGLPPVRASRGALQQVVSNLVSNALAAMRDNGGRLVFRARNVPAAQTEGGRAVTIEVQDTGRGMDDHTAAHAFDPFFTTKPFGQGVGLGLATAQSIVEAFGGHLDFETSPGRGSVFRVRLPSAANGQAGSRGSEPEREAPRPACHDILLVEDNPESRTAIRLQLIQLGMKVEAVGSAEAALAGLEAEGQGIDLLIVGARMPGASGLDLAECVRQRWPALPILITSGFADATIQAQAARIGVGHVLAKPFSTPELAEAMAELCDSRPESVSAAPSRTAS